MKKFICVLLILISGFFCWKKIEFTEKTHTVNPYGVCAHLTRWEFKNADEELALMKNAGVSAVRSGVEWGNVEKEKNQFNFNLLDELYAKINKANIEVLAVIPGSCTPKFAQPFPHHIDDLAEFSAKLVSRYKGKVKYWEMVNEPDGLSFWGGLKPNASEYRNLIKKVYPAIKKANPDAVVLFGGLSGTPIKYMEEVFADGGAECFDIMNIHPYSFTSVPEDRLIERIRDTRKAMQKYGIGHKPIWITEIGYASANPNPSSIEYIKRAIKICGIDISKAVVSYIGDEKYNFFSDAMTGDINVIIPDAKGYHRITFSDLKNLSSNSYPLLFLGENQAFPYKYLADLKKYLTAGGIVITSGAVPFYYDIRISKRGNAYQAEVGTKTMEKFRIAVRTKDDPEMNFVKKYLLNRPVVRGDVVKKESGDLFKDIKPKGHYRGKFFASTSASAREDKFIPMLYGVFGDKKVPLAGIYKYGGDMSGAFISIFSRGKEYVSEDVQAELLPRMYILARSEGIERVFKYSFRNSEYDFSRESHFGMIRKNLAPKPSYFAYKTLTKMLGDSIPTYKKVDNVHIAEWTKDDGTSISAVWTTRYPKCVNLKIDGKIKDVKNIFGEPTTYKINKTGNMELKIDGRVRYIIGAKIVGVEK